MAQRSKVISLLDKAELLSSSIRNLNVDTMQNLNDWRGENWPIGEVRTFGTGASAKKTYEDHESFVLNGHYSKGTRGLSAPKHHHPDGTELIEVVKGIMWDKVTNRFYQKGERLFLPKNILHWIANGSNEELILNVTFYF